MLPELSIPAEISPDGVETILLDTSGSAEGRGAMERALASADVACIVYSVESSQSFHRLGTFWLPLVRAQRPGLSVVLVGNKIDTRGDDVTNEELEDEILPLMSDFKEIETCVECSAKTLVNVAEAFYFAQKAVLHPTGPLYDSREHELRAEAIRALERIFRLCDRDADGILSDEELNAFQVKCFRTPLQEAELESIKEILKEVEPRGVQKNGVTLPGFLALHRLFIQRGRLETTWSALRAFGYTDELQLKDELLHPQLNLKKNGVMVLGPKANEFLTRIFHAWDHDGRGSLTAAQLEELFMPVVLGGGLEWYHGLMEASLTDSSGALTLTGFLGQWALMALLDPHLVLTSLALLGCEEPFNCILVVCNGLRRDRTNRRQRDAFLVWVLGATGSGKTALRRSLLQRPFAASYVPSMEAHLAINSVPVDGRERFLVLEEIPTHGALDREALADAERLAHVDAICLVYDESDPASFTHIQQLYEEHKKTLAGIPILLLATKSDKTRNANEGVDKWLQSQNLPEPTRVSAKEMTHEEMTTRIWAPLLAAALAGDKQKASTWFLPVLGATCAVGAAAAVAYYYLRLRHHEDKSD